MSATSELRAAAEKLRGLSGMASRGGWHVEPNRPSDDGQSYAVRPYYPGTHEPAWFKVADGCTVMDANLIATMNPTVSVALADWLEDHIEDHSSYDCDTDGPCAGVRLARAINGGAS